MLGKNERNSNKIKGNPWFIFFILVILFNMGWSWWSLYIMINFVWSGALSHSFICYQIRWFNVLFKFLRGGKYEYRHLISTDLEKKVHTFWEYWFGGKSLLIKTNLKLQQDCVNQLSNQNAFFLFLLTGGTSYYHDIHIVFTYFSSFTGRGGG